MKHLLIFAICGFVSVSSFATNHEKFVFNGVKYLWINESNEVSVERIVDPPEPSATLVIPSTITETILEEFLYPETVEFTVTGIESGAFNGISLESLILPPSIKEISTGALTGSTIRNLTLPSGLISIHPQGISNIRNLESLIIPEGTRILNRYAIDLRNDGNYELKYLELPSSIEYLGSWSLLGLVRLEKMRINATVPPEATINSFGIGFGAYSMTDCIMPSINAACILEVPRGCAETYRNHPEWGNAFYYISEFDPAGIDIPTENPASQSLSATSSPGCINITTNHLSNISVVRPDGAIVYTGHINGSTSLRMPSGVYIVSTLGHSIKLTVP